MAANKLIVLGPTTLGIAAVNIYSPPTGITGGVAVPATITNAYYIFKKIRVVNTLAAALSFALWKQITIGAAPVAGKEFIWGGTATLLVLDVGRGQSVAGGAQVEWSGTARLAGDEADKFLVGVASAVGLTIEAEAEIGFI